MCTAFPTRSIACRTRSLRTMMPLRSKAMARESVAVVAGRVRASRVEPGQETVGVVGVKLPVAKDGPTVLRLVFPGDGKAQPTATLVL